MALGKWAASGGCRSATKSRLANVLMRGGMRWEKAMSSPKRVLLSPVYMTAGERDLVRSALEALCSSLQPDRHESNGAIAWAKSYSSRRITETIALFADKQETV
jgi:hypothetical protein